MRKYSSLVKPDWKRSKTPKHKNPKLYIKRAIIILIALLISYLVIAGIFNAIKWIVNGRQQSNYIDTELTTWGGQTISEGFVIRDEVVEVAPTTGTLNLLASQSQLLEAGDLVGEIIDRQQLAQVEEELQEINDEISKYEQGSVTDSSDISLATYQESVGKVRESIKDYVFSRNKMDITNINTHYDKLRQQSERFLDVWLQTTKLTRSKNQLLQRQEELLQIKEESVNQLFAPTRGYITMTLDGLETVRASDIEQIDVADLQASQLTAPQHGDLVEEGQPLFKFVKEQPWYLITKLAKSDADQIRVAEHLDILHGENELNGNTYTYLEEEDYNYLVLEMKGEPLIDERIIEITLSRDSQKGIEVPASAIFNDGEVKCVYVLVDGENIKTPVYLLGEQGDRALIEGVSVGEKILLDAASIKRGEN